MMIMDKIVHYQVPLTQKNMDELKIKTEKTTAVGALTAAVELILSDHGGNEQ